MLQYVAVLCCCVLQRLFLLTLCIALTYQVAVCALQCVAVLCCSVLQSCVAVHCSLCIAVCCSVVLQRVAEAIPCNTLHYTNIPRVAVCCSVLQCVAATLYITLYITLTYHVAPRTLHITLTYHEHCLHITNTVFISRTHITNTVFHSNIPRRSLLAENYTIYYKNHTLYSVVSSL